MTPKVSYLQFEIMEVVFEKKLKELSLITGYNDDSKILIKAINSLLYKGLLNKNKELTERGLSILNDHYKDRHEHKKYDKRNLKIEREFNISQKDSVSRWYKYLEDFPTEFVSSILSKYKIDKKYYVMDPFLGSATTLIEAKKAGYKSVGIDINPAMVFIASSKMDWALDSKEVEKKYYKIVNNFIKRSFTKKDFELIKKTPLGNMPKAEINQWLSPVKQIELAFLMLEIDKIKEKKYRNILMLALTRSAINASYVAFCPGTTFYPFRKKKDLIIEFKESVTQIISDIEGDKRLLRNKEVKSDIIHGSSKSKKSMSPYKGKVDLIITSPPYPNDLEYTRQTRLEMYMLNIVKSMQEVQNIKRGMVKGSTKLIYNTDNALDVVRNLESLKKITQQVAFNLKGKNWGFDYPKMLEMYFSDMYECMQRYFDVLIKGGTAVLVVGDQTTKGVLVPVAEILAELAEKIGFKKCEIEFHRKRRSTGHDIEIPEENLILTK